MGYNIHCAGAELMSLLCIQDRVRRSSIVGLFEEDNFLLILLYLISYNPQGNLSSC